MLFSLTDPLSSERKWNDAWSFCVTNSECLQFQCKSFNQLDQLDQTACYQALTLSIGSLSIWVRGLNGRARRFDELWMGQWTAARWIVRNQMVTIRWFLKSSLSQSFSLIEHQLGFRLGMVFTVRLVHNRTCSQARSDACRLIVSLVVRLTFTMGAVLPAKCTDGQKFKSDLIKPKTNTFLSSFENYQLYNACCKIVTYIVWITTKRPRHKARPECSSTVFIHSVHLRCSSTMLVHNARPQSTNGAKWIRRCADLGGLCDVLVVVF